MAKKKKTYGDLGEEQSKARQPRYPIVRDLLGMKIEPAVTVGISSKKIGGIDPYIWDERIVVAPSDVLLVADAAERENRQSANSPLDSARSRLISQINGYALMQAGAEAVEAQIYSQIRSIWASIDSPDHHLQYVRARLAEAVS